MWRLSPGTMAPAVNHTPWDTFLERPAPSTRLALVGPVETAVRDPRPVCRWRRTEPTTSLRAPGHDPEPPEAGPRGDTYELTILRLEPDGALAPVESWTGLTGTTHRPWRALEDGQYYLWRVRVRGTGRDGDAPEEASAWFRVMTELERRRADAALEMLARTAAEHPEATGAMSALHATRLEQFGLLGEAEERWRELALLRPDSESMVMRLSRVRWRGLVVPRRTAATPLPFGRRLDAD